MAGGLRLRGEVLDGLINIAKLAKDWDDLFGRAQEASVYLSSAWVQTFISEKRIRGTPLLILVWCGSKLVALLPLGIRSFCGISIAEPIGTTEVSYLGLLVDPNYPGAIQTVADVWEREKVAQAFYDKHLSSLDEVTNELIAELRRRGFAFKRGYRRVSPWIGLGCSFDAYLENAKSIRRRKRLLYEERRVFRAGNVMVVRYIGKDITAEVIARIATTQQESWMKRRGAALLNKPFYQKLLLEMAKAGLARVWIMTIDTDDAAFGCAFVAHRGLDLKWIAFKLKYESTLSIGKILMMQIVRDACQEGMLSVGLGFGDCEWKRFWGTDNHNVESVVVGQGLGYMAVLCYGVMWWLAKHERLFSLYRRFKKWRNIQTGCQKVQINSVKRDNE